MRAKTIRTGLIVLLILLAAGAAAFAVSNYGSEDDPLIAKSYLDSVVLPELRESMRTEVDKALEDVRGGSGAFTVLTLQNGQRVTCEVGTEILPRIGAAAAYAYDSADVALVDTTSSAALKNGDALSANHLYMVTIRGNGFTAAENNTKVLISGAYTLE